MRFKKKICKVNPFGTTFNSRDAFDGIVRKITRNTMNKITFVYFGMYFIIPPLTQNSIEVNF